MSQRLRYLGVASLLGATLLLALSALVVNLGLRNLQSSRTLVTRTSAIERLTAEFQAALRAAETGQRGYLLTGEPRYLVSYERGRVAVPRTYRELTELVRDPAQVSRLRALSPLVDEKLAELAQTIALRERSLAAALRIVRTDRGQALSERIDQGLADFNEAERQLLTQRVTAEAREARRTTIAAAATALLSLLSALLGLWLIFQQRTTNALARQNAELERRVEHRTADLEAANRELDAYAYTISHDLRAPLRAMHGYADAVLEDYGETLPPEGLGFLHAIAAAAIRMNALIEDILTYARLSREDITARPQPLAPIVERARTAALEAVGHHGEISVSEPLGSAWAHGPMLEQMVLNLLTNALKFIAPGQTAAVLVSSEQQGTKLRLIVEDNGIGILPEHREQIFEPFSRLHGMESYPGTGIGLAIVRRGAKRMGGKAGLDPAPNGGSRFWIELRAAQVGPAT